MEIWIENMSEYTNITLTDRPQLKERADVWFYSKWEVPQEAYPRVLRNPALPPL